MNDTLTIPLGIGVPTPCPNCASTAGLHFDDVSLIDPLGEAIALHAESESLVSVVSATVAHGHRESRLHWLVLTYWCGVCEMRGEITLRQSRGQTFTEHKTVGALHATKPGA